MHALRAFEAAARHLSFSRAAEELNLTHGAVSHALRNLEAELATPQPRKREARASAGASVCSCWAANDTHSACEN